MGSFASPFVFNPICVTQTARQNPVQGKVWWQAKMNVTIKGTYVCVWERSESDPKRKRMTPITLSHGTSLLHQKLSITWNDSRGRLEVPRYLIGEMPSFLHECWLMRKMFGKRKKKEKRLIPSITILPPFSMRHARRWTLTMIINPSSGNRFLVTKL